MDAVAFLRGINTGNRTLKTAEFARGMEPFRLENIGAAGTFVARGVPSLNALHGAISARLPFATEILVVAGTDVTALIRSQPFGRVAPPKGVRRAVSIVSSPVPRDVRLPMARPSARAWEVQILAARGPFVLSTTRRLRPNRILYPNAVVEKEFGVKATTRWWETLERAAELLDAAGPA